MNPEDPGYVEHTCHTHDTDGKYIFNEEMDEYPDEREINEHYTGD